MKIDEESGCVLLTIRGTTAVQELRIYSRDIAKTKLDLARTIRGLGFHIGFAHH